MKNKGQVLVAFLLLLPLLFFLMAMVVDLGMEAIQYKKIKGTVFFVLSFALKEEAPLQEVENLFLKNGFSEKDFVVRKEEEKYYVKIIFSPKSFFGKMWRKDTKESLEYLAYKREEQIVIKRMEE